MSCDCTVDLVSLVLLSRGSWKDSLMKRFNNSVLESISKSFRSYTRLFFSFNSRASDLISASRKDTRKCSLKSSVSEGNSFSGSSDLR